MFDRNGFVLETHNIAWGYFDELEGRLLADKEFVDAFTKSKEESLDDLTFPKINFPASGMPLLKDKSIRKAIISFATKKIQEHFENRGKNKESTKEKNNKSTEILISRMRHHVQSMNPGRFETVQKALGYEVFLRIASDGFLPPEARSALDYEGSAARLKTEVLQQRYLTEGLEILKEYCEESAMSGAVIERQTAALLKGQDDFRQYIEKAGKTKQKDVAAAKEAAKKLDKLGVEVKGQLSTLLEDSHDIREKVTMISNYITHIEEQKQRQAETQGLMDAAGFIGALGQHLGSKSLCQISTIAQAGIKIATCVSALQAGLTTGLSLTSLTPVVGIGMGVLSIAGLFGKQGPDPSEAVLFAIQQLASLVNTLRIEMHQRFDRIEDILFVMHRDLIIGFCDVQRNQKKILTLLDDIYSEVTSTKVEMRELISSLSDKVRSIHSLQYSHGRREKIESISEKIRFVTGTHSTFSSEEFKKSYNKFVDHIMGSHSADPLLVGDKALSPGQVVTCFEMDEGNPLASDFHVRALLDITHQDGKEIPKLVNPAIWSLEVMGLMALVKAYYTLDDEKSYRISKAELEELAKVSRLGKETASYAKQLQNPAFLKKLMDQYQSSAVTLQKCLDKVINEEEVMITKKLDKEYSDQTEFPELRDSKLTSREYAKSAFELFQKQVILVNPAAGSGWFSGQWANYHPRCFPGGIFEPWYDFASGRAAQYVDQYKNGRSKSITSLMTQYVEKIKTQQGRSHGRFKYFSIPNVEQHHHYLCAMPEEKEHPILPLPDFYQSPIAKSLQLAEWLGLGKVHHQYRITSEDKPHFILETYFQLPEEKPHLVSALSTAYEPGIYKDPKFKNEAIWWFWSGGNFCKTGAYSRNTYAQPTTSENNTWKNHVNEPISTDNIGRFRQIKLENGILLHAEEKIYFTETSDFALSIMKRIKAEQNKYKALLYKKIKHEIESNQDSDLGKAFIAYSHAFYLLKTALTIAFGTNNLEKFKVFQLVMEKTGLSSRYEIANILESLIDKEVSIQQLIAEHVQTMTKDLPLAIRVISEEKNKETILDRTLRILDTVMASYEPTAVDENQLHSRIAHERQQAELIDTFQGVLGCLKDAVLTLDLATQQQFLVAMQKQISLKGITGPATSLLAIGTSSVAHVDDSKVEMVRTPPIADPLLISPADSSLLQFSTFQPRAPGVVAATSTVLSATDRVELR